MSYKRLLYYLLLNIFVSAVTVLVILNIWDRTHRTEIGSPEQISLLPTVIASAVPPTPIPTTQPTQAKRSYQVVPGDSLSEIAQIFGVSVSQLLEINNLENPDELSTGMVLEIPQSGTTSQDSADQSQGDNEEGSQQEPTLTPLPIPESSEIRIVTIVGVDDLATEHLQIQSISPEALSLEGWRLETNDGLVYNFPNITLFEHGAVDLYSRAGINSVVALYWGQSSPIFQSGDQAVIYDAEGNLKAAYSIP